MKEGSITIFKVIFNIRARLPGEKNSQLRGTEQ